MFSAYVLSFYAELQRHVENHWESTFDSLSDSSEQSLRNAGCVWTPYPGTTTSLPTTYDCTIANTSLCYVPSPCVSVCLPDECWEGLRHVYFDKFKVGALVVFAFCLMLPIQIYTVGIVSLRNAFALLRRIGLTYFYRCASATRGLRLLMPCRTPCRW